MIETPAFQRAKRQAWALTIYRWLIGVAFLLLAFSSFPEHKLALGFGYLFFAYSIESVAKVVTILFLAENRLSELAERKTRHTVLLAAERAPPADDIGRTAFWEEVDWRVSKEMGYPAPSPPLWKSFIFISGGILGRLAWDALGLTIAFIVTG